MQSVIITTNNDCSVLQQMLSGLLFVTTAAQFLLRLSNRIKDGDSLLKADIFGPATLAVTVVCN